MIRLTLALTLLAAPVAAQQIPTPAEMRAEARTLDGAAQERLLRFRGTPGEARAQAYADVMRGEAERLRAQADSLERRPPMRLRPLVCQ